MLGLIFLRIPAYLLAILLTPALLADSSIWTLLIVRQTGFTSGLAALSATGPVYLAYHACPAPTITLGNASQSASCVSKADVSGQPQFAVQIGGAFSPELVLDSAGNVFVTGDAGRGLETTPGVYEPSPPDATDPFVCKLNNTDGKPLFCTFLDVANLGSDSFTVDSAGNTYIAGLCGSDFAHPCVEKLNPDGSALIYRTNLGGGGSNHLAVDSYGNLYVLYGTPLQLLKLDPGGRSLVAVNNFQGDLAGYQYPNPLALDQRGNPQALSVGTNGMRVTRYTSDLSKTLFETSFSIGSHAVILAWAIDSAGVTDIFGTTAGANLPLLHPTQFCHQPNAASFSSSNEFLVRIGNDGKVFQSTYFSGDVAILTGPQAFITPSQDGASVLVLDDSDYEYRALDLGPATSEVTLACLGNAASFQNMPLAPNELISIFGTALGPTDPVIGQAGTDGLYTFQLGNTRVTFDGTAAPMLYASSGQINMVTPGALAGKTTTHICVISSGAQTNCIDAIVQPAAPGIFYFGQTAYAAAVNQDGTINSQHNPAPIGSIVSVFATGLGSMTPSPPDGSFIFPPLPMQDLKVLGQYPRTSPDGQSPALPGSTDVLYAGPAPFELEGVSQINLRVPPPPGLFNRGPVSFWIDVTGASFGSNVVLLWYR